MSEAALSFDRARPMSALKDDIFVGRTALIAGGTRGINFGIAQRLHKLGAKVAMLGRDPERAASAQNVIGDKSLGIACDVRDGAALASALATIAEWGGPLDFVISGAAGNFVARAKDMSSNGFRTVVDIDLIGTFNVFKCAFDHLNSDGASLIAITAGQAVNPILGQAHVCAAKAGINQLVRVLAMEWGAHGVRVNGISPGPIDGTEGMARLTPDAKSVERLTRNIPLRRFGTISEVAEVAAFLCSESASYVTGTIFDCDGGSQHGMVEAG